MQCHASRFGPCGAPTSFISLFLSHCFLNLPLTCQELHRVWLIRLGMYFGAGQRLRLCHSKCGHHMQLALVVLRDRYCRDGSAGKRACRSSRGLEFSSEPVTPAAGTRGLHTFFWAPLALHSPTQLHPPANKYTYF